MGFGLYHNKKGRDRLSYVNPTLIPTHTRKLLLHQTAGKLVTNLILITSALPIMTGIHVSADYY